MWEWLKFNFSWYGGAVWPNIWAWFVCGVPTIVILFRRHSRKLKAHLTQKHETLTQHMEEQFWDFLGMHNEHKIEDSPEFTESAHTNQDQTE